MNVVDEFLYNIRGIEWGSIWIPLQYKSNRMNVVDEFLYNIRWIEWGSRWIPLQYKMNRMR